MKRAFLTAAVLLLAWTAPVATVRAAGDQASASSSISAPPQTAATDAATAEEPDKGDVAWMLTASALVLMMTAPGLALFYGGLVRKKNVLSVMMQCVFLMGLMSIVWALWGYSLAFGGSNPFVGDFRHLLLRGVLPELSPSGQTHVPMSGTIPTSVFMVFQMMFFIITPALICGAFAERMKFSAMVLFMLLWGTFIYCPVAHWVWSDSGWLCEWNRQALFPALDFAGGTVVHVSSGVSALVCALVLGRRLHYGREPMPPHNLTYTCVGAALLWVGWFGFNAGSALSANATAANAFVSTHMAAAAGVVAWAVAEWLHDKPTILGACSGAVAGLVCITPAAGSVNAIQALVLGAAAGVVCYLACTRLKARFNYDDSLDAFGVHGVGGTLGALLTGVFASKSVTGGTFGLLEGNPMQLLNQLVAVGATAALSVVGTVVLLKVVDALVGLRVAEDDEVKGLDLTQHGEEGYIFL